MNKKIKVIELLNKIANGEDLPTKIQYGYDKNNCCAIWILNPSLKDYSCNERNVGDNQLFRDYIGDITVVLNNEVKVLEDNTEEIEEIPEERIENCTDRNYAYLAEKYNKLAKVVNEIRKESEDKQ